jgi:probable F420-dependent oxidoreductase
VITPPRLAVTLPVAGQVVGTDLPGLVDIARQCEVAGVDTVVLVDHVVMGERFDRYAWGPFRFEQGAPWAEPLTLASAIAGTTATVRIATGILIAGLRPAPLLAKTVATLDRIAGGRFDLGVGVGWQPEEYESMGLDFTRRGDILDDTIGACLALWTQSPASFTSSTVTFDRIWCDPKPLQPGGPPVWFSGTLGPRNVRRIVEFGHGWIPIMGATVDDVHVGARLLRKRFAEAGRDPGELHIRGGAPLARTEQGFDVQATVACTRELVDAGATEVNFPMSAFVRETTDVGPWLAELTTAWADTWETR